MTTLKNYHEVSAWFFFLLALGYVVCALALRNDYQAGMMLFLMRLLDVPFAFVCLSYGGSGLYLQLTNDKEEADSVWGILIFAFSLLFFALIVFINFAFPSTFQ